MCVGIGRSLIMLPNQLLIELFEISLQTLLEYTKSLDFNFVLCRNTYILPKLALRLCNVQFNITLSYWKTKANFYGCATGSTVSYDSPHIVAPPGALDAIPSTNHVLHSFDVRIVDVLRAAFCVLPTSAHTYNPDVLIHNLHENWGTNTHVPYKYIALC